MMTQRRWLHSFLIVEILLLLIITTLTFLPNLSQATIFRDDWYYTMDRLLGGPDAFHEMFHIDRPARGYFFEAYYRLFGVEPAPYHAVAFFFRLLVGVSALWLFYRMWPGQRAAIFLMSLMFVLYPGYTRWMEGFENQPKVVSLFCQVASIVLTLEAIRARGVIKKVILWTASILSGWVYISLIDYAIGMEAFRFLCVFFYLNRDRMDLNLFQKGVRTLRAAAPALLVAGVFLFWRVLIFNNERAETDIGRQLGLIVESPLMGGLSWLVSLLKSFINDAVLAWAGPAFQDLFELPFAAVLQGLLIAFAVLACTLVGLAWIRRSSLARPHQPPCPEGPWQTEALWIGTLGVIGGVLPVVLANRSVEFGVFSHYGMPASLASAVLLVGFLYAIRSVRLRLVFTSVLVLLAVLTHYSASAKVAREERVIANFWHQVAWRAPAIREATGLLVHYPGVAYGEDVDAVNGPANYIYFPEPSNELPVRYKLYAMKHYPWTVKEFMTGGKGRVGYRTHYGVIDYGEGYLLVMSQPSEDACVHVIDRQYPWFSYDDPDAVVAIGPHSNPRNILVDQQPPALSPTIFGPEPEHGWCYYFQKASLALQTQDWSQLVDLADSVDQLGLKPNDPLEWMPFIQAFAQLGEVERLQAALQPILALEAPAYNQRQVCQVMTAMQEQGSSFTPDIQEIVSSTVCIE